LSACAADRGEHVPSPDAAVELEPVRASDVRGRFARVITPGLAVRFEVASGRVRAIVPDSEKRTVLRTASVTLPARANEAVRLEDDATRVSIEFALQGARAASVTTGAGLAIYPKALDGADVIHRVQAAGTEDFIVFEAKPAREAVEYRVDVSHTPGLRLVGSTLELLDEGGTPRLRVAPPYVVDARGLRHDATLAVEGCAYDTNTAAPWDRPVTPPGATSCVVRVGWGTVEYPAVLDPAWTATGSLATARAQATATLLGSGKVLVAGGFASGGALSSAELFDGTGSFAAAASMKAARTHHTATLFGSGKVLLAGGDDGSGFSSSLSTAEVFDGATFASTGAMTARSRHAAVLLPSGKVLLVGGVSTSFLGSAVTGAQLFDGVGAFSAGGTTKDEHGADPTATLLGSGKVLVAGGGVSSAEIFDGVGTFTLTTGSMAAPRSGHGAALLPSGKVLLVGGAFGGVGGSPLSSAETFDPAGTFAATGPLSTVRASHTTTLLATGMVVVAGGSNASSGGALSSSEVFTAPSFVSVGSMTTPRAQHAATALSSPAVLVVGGQDGAGAYLSTAEILTGLAPLGKTCTGSTDCDSAHCVDGRCCNTSCTGTCDACDLPSSSGTCSHVTGLPHGSRGSCGTFVCQGTSAVCPTSCVDDTGCASTAFCNGGTCMAKRAVGAACATGVHECSSAFTVDGVCCSTACNGTCQACSASVKGSGPDGMCGSVADGKDPHATCSPPICSDGKRYDNVCNGAAGCRPVTTSCAPFKCNAAGTDCEVACTTDADCGATSGNYCVSGVCTAKKKRGEACTTNTECSSTFCADSVCCDNACNGSCQACGEPGKEGTCGPITGAPRAGHAACKAAGTTCGGTCDGSKVFDCSFPGASTTCDDGCKDGAIARCDGTGACSAATPCPGNFRCADANTCKSSCLADSDCTGGYTCKSGACSPPPSATCNADDTVSTSASGAEQPCSPYRCTSTGACGTECTNTTDCDPSAVCDRSSKQCVNAGPTDPPEGCNCALSPEKGSQAIALLPLLALILARRRSPIQSSGRRSSLP
jgi:MYXO-CTERM domain-containing protein